MKTGKGSVHQNFTNFDQNRYGAFFPKINLPKERVLFVRFNLPKENALLKKHSSSRGCFFLWIFIFILLVSNLCWWKSSIQCGTRPVFVFKWPLQWRSFALLVEDSLSILPCPHSHSAFFLFKDSDSYSSPCQGLKVIGEMVRKCKHSIQLRILWSASHLLFFTCHWGIAMCTSHWMLVTGASLQFNSERSSCSAFLCFATVYPSSSSQVALLAPPPLPSNCSKPASESLWSLCSTSQLKYFLAPSWCNSVPHMALGQLLKRSKRARTCDCDSYLALRWIPSRREACVFKLNAKESDQ